MTQSAEPPGDRSLRLLLKFLARGNFKAIAREFQNPPPTDYLRWRQLQRYPTRNTIQSGPKFSIISPDPSSNESLRRQLYPNWELAPDLASATGQFISFIDPGDKLPPHALLRIAQEILANPSLDVLYSDEDRLSPSGQHSDPFFKPDWSPEYFQGWAYIGRLAAYRRDLILDVGGIRPEFADAFEYDLLLRLIARNATIAHIPDVLYHRSASNSIAPSPAAARRTLEANGQKVEDGPAPGTHRLRFPIVGNPLVSIVIPSACRPITIKNRQTWFLLECISSIRRLTTYSNIEIIALDNNDMPADLAAALKPFDIRIVHFTEEFNLTRKINLGASHARGEQLLLLNDDVEVISPDWIESMLEYSQQPQIGAVGAKLLFPNNTQQHTGVILLNGNPRHPFYGRPADHPGYFHSSQVVRNWSAVTGACMMTRAGNYKKVAGFSEEFPLNYNDIDYCLKLLDTGLRIVCTPFALLYHHESVSKTGTYREEFKVFERKWRKKFPRDPYYNPNLTRHFRVKL
jgi:GT2 family glycosyltransferase